ncbi:MAG: hypothetical protein AAFR97_10055, partial [Bacteroidota bacterium]
RLSTKAAIDFSSNFIINKASYDNVTSDVLFNDTPPDYSFFYSPKKSPLTHQGIKEKQVIEALYSSEIGVPCWIDISVIKSSKEETRLILHCSDRASLETKALYYTRQNTYPFGIKSPVHKPWLRPDEKYRLYYVYSFFGNLREKIRWWYFTGRIKISR